MTPSTAKPGTQTLGDVPRPFAVPTAQPMARRVAKPWQIPGGLAVSGFLLALPGGLLPLWGYHIRPDFGTAGNYFLALGAGIVGGGALALRLSRTVTLERLLTGGYIAAASAIIMLAFAAPPAQVWYQMLAMLATGLAAGIMNCAVLEAMTPWYESSPTRAILTGGIFFGGGSLLAALLLAQSFGGAGAVRLLAIAALLPATAGVWFARLRVERPERAEIPRSRSMGDLRSPLAIFFALLLFFQFANEWSIAGWLPVYLIDRMGVSPSTAVNLLALYWLSLTGGRIAASRLVKVVRNGKLLGISAFCALFGCTGLLAGNRFGAIAGLLLTGVGFSVIYPLVSERISSRFSYYHPGYFNGIFTFALMGGLLAPFALGHLAERAGLNVIPVATMVGSCAVFALISLIWLGHKVSGK